MSTLDYFLELYHQHIVQADEKSWVNILYKLAWDNQDGSNVFCNLGVDRDLQGPCSTLKIPKECWVLKGSADTEITGSTSAVTDILVRHEYMVAARHLITHTEGGISHFLVGEEEPDYDTEDDSPVGHRKSSFRNPFIETPPRAGRHRVRDVIVTGSPGIGKTLFLHVLLAMRLNARLTTLLQLDKNEVFLFAEGGVYRIDPQIPLSGEDSDKFADLFPTAWILVDSNESLTHISKFVLLTGLDIIQAVSPRPNQFRWINKRNGCCLKYVMKPWNICELIVGRQFQTEGRKTEKELQCWCDRYAPLARLAYCHAGIKANDYEHILAKKLKSLNIATFINLVQSAAASKLDSISDETIIILPGTSRCQAITVVPTYYLSDLIITTISTNMDLTLTETYLTILSDPRLQSLFRHLIMKGKEKRYGCGLLRAT